MHRFLALSLALLAGVSVAAQGRYDGALEASDATLISGEFSDTYTVPLQQGQWVEVVMRSGDFDPYVILRPPSCPDSGTCEVQFDNDDFFPDGSSFLWVEANESGTWDVLATSYAPGDKGRYVLDVVAHPAGAIPQTPGVLLEATRTERGALADGDETLRSGEYVDRFSFVGRAGDRVSVDLRSSAFDPYLILQMPGEDQLDNDDWEGDRERSRIEHTLPADGMYSVLVTSYAVDETGAYELQMSAAGEGDAGSDPFSK